MENKINIMKHMVIFYNETPGVWLFPDGEVITRYYEALQRANKLGMTLEQPKLHRFSDSH